MRPRLAFAALAALVLAACSEAGVAPNDPLARAPTVQLTQLGEDPATYDLCDGLSPCDAFDYRGDGTTGAEGICFLPPTVESHLSDPACSAPNRPGLDGLFQLAWCQVDYSADPTGATPPTIVSGSCQDPADWKDLVEDDGFYSASVRWRRSEADDGDIFRVYVVRGEQVFAHRDLVIDPNLTTPADGYVHAIGYGNEPIKVRISEDFACIKFDTQGETPENAATCLIAGATTVSFETARINTTFNFPDGNPTFLADFEVSECLSLGFDIDAATGLAEGLALVDVPLAGCKISLSSEELDALTVPGQIVVDFIDERWNDSGAPFENARLNVLQYDEDGIGALPPSTPPSPNWFGEARSEFAALRWLDRGLDLLADLLLPEPLYARIGGWDYTRMSDFQVSVQPVMDGASGVVCSVEEPYCRDLGTFDSGGTASVSVQVSAPTDDGPTQYPNNHLDVPDTRLHFFPQSGTVSCPAGSAPAAFGRGCVEAGDPDLSTDPPSTWNHVVVITDTDGIGSVDWALGDGDNTLLVSACGVARPGNEPNPPSEPGADRVWGTLGDCSDRELAAFDTDAFSNGPADGFTPFEPVDTENEVAIYGRPLEFRAATCPTITVDGLKGDGGSEWETCAEKTIFTAPLKGPKVEDNAALYTYSDGAALYVGVEVETNDLGGKIFINLAESVAGGDGVEAPGDDILVIDFDDPTGGFDWHLTEACTGNNSASLCGDPDGPGDGAKAVFAAAMEGGAGQGKAFYEFVRPFGSPNSTAPDKEDLGASSGEIALKLTVTQGQGGGKGGFIYPDPQSSSTQFHVFTIE